MNAKVVVVGYLRFPQDQIAHLMIHLRELVEATRRNDGCITYDAAEDPFDQGVIRFSELWPDQESLDRHLKAPHIEPWREAVRQHGLMERQFTVYDISGARPL